MGTIELKIQRCKDAPWALTCALSCGKCFVPPSPPPPPPCEPYSPAELISEQTKCQWAFDEELVRCSVLTTKKERKKCREANVNAHTECKQNLYCPPDGTKS